MRLTPFATVSVEEMTDVEETPVENSELDVYAEEAPEIGVPEENLDDSVSDADVIEDVGEELEGLESLSSEIEHLTNLAGAIEQYGISPGMMLVADRDGLLASTFISIPATESMVQPYRPNSATSTTALEGVMDAIKSKTSEWAAKAGSSVKSLGTKAGAMVMRMAKGAADLVKWTAMLPWNATKAVAAKVKAHPYKTIVVVLAAIAAVAGVLALIWAFPETAEGIAAWGVKVKRAVESLKYPGGGFKVTAEGGVLEAKWVGTAADGTRMYTTDAESLSVLGWTKASLVGAAKGLGRVAVVGAYLTHIGASAWANVEAWRHLFKRVAKGGGPLAAANAYVRGTFVGYFAVWKFVIKMTWLLIKKVVVGGYNLVKSAVTAVGHAVSGGKAEPAAA